MKRRNSSDVFKENIKKHSKRYKEMHKYYTILDVKKMYATKE